MDILTEFLIELFQFTLLVSALVIFWEILTIVFKMFCCALNEACSGVIERLIEEYSNFSNTKRQQEKNKEEHQTRVELVENRIEQYKEQQVEQPERVLSPMEQKIQERADMLIYQENEQQ